MNFGSFGNIVQGYLGKKANQKLGGIKNPLARRLAGSLLGASPLGQIIPGLNNPPRNPDQNLLFGARNLSELQLREQLVSQTDQASNFTIPQGTNPVAENFDWRARLRPKRGGAAYVYGQYDQRGEAQSGTNILQPIIDTDGLVSVSYTHLTLPTMRTV